jgi:hypothetical protein
VVLTHLDTSAEFLQKYLSSESLWKSNSWSLCARTRCKIQRYTSSYWNKRWTMSQIQRRSWILASAKTYRFGWVASKWKVRFSRCKLLAKFQKQDSVLR